MIYNTGNQVVTFNAVGVYSTLALNTLGPSANTTVAVNQITVTQSGTYEIHYNINAFGASRTYTAAVLRNGVAITPTTTTVTATQAANGSFIATLSADTLVTLNAGDVLTLGLASDIVGTTTVGGLGNATLSVKQL